MHCLCTEEEHSISSSRWTVHTVDTLPHLIEQLEKSRVAVVILHSLPHCEWRFYVSQPQTKPNNVGPTVTHAFSETCIFPLSLSLCLCLESEFQTFGHGEIKKSQTVQAILSCRYGGFNMLLCTIVENGANTRICRESCECRDYALFCLFLLRNLLRKIKFWQKFCLKNWPLEALVGM